MTPATNNDENEQANLFAILAFALDEIPLFCNLHDLDLLLGRYLCPAAVGNQSR
jgi:hypothetical protein